MDNMEGLVSFYRYVPKMLKDPCFQPFESAEEAWFWYCKYQIARLEGARFHATEAAGVARPCDPDDVYTVVDRLYRTKDLRRCHLVVLGDFGLRLTPPLSSNPGEREQARIWCEALDVITPVLQAKGIVL
jgi:hypothetical protein